MKTSARNQFEGKIKAIRTGAVNDEIVINVSPNRDIVAIITGDSTKKLNLAEGSDVVALIKASSVILAANSNGLVFSARNQFSGSVTVVSKGAVNSDIVIDAGDGVQIGAIITNTSLDNLGIKAGSQVTAIFKASSVIVAAKA